MGRAAQTTRSQIDQQRAMQNQINQQLLGERQNLSGVLLPQYKQLLNQGYTPEEQAAITGQTLGSLGTAYDALRQNAAERLAQTRNSAGYGEALDELGRQQTRDTAGVAQQNQIQFAQQQQNNLLKGLQGIASLYGVDTGLLAQGLGIPAQLLSDRARVSGGGSGSTFGALTGLGTAGLGLF
jgi:hypothetical protein